MSTPSIEKGIPIPPRSQSHHGKWKAKFAEMKDGDSFLVDDNATRCIVLNCAMHHGLKLTTRKVDGKGYRIWKTGRRRA